MEKKEKKRILPMPESIHEAAQRAACRRVLARFIDAGGPDQTDDESRTPLHYACAASRHGVVRFLLERGGNPNLADMSGWTPLHLACLLGKKTTAALLVSAGAHPMARNLMGDTPADLTENQLIKKMLERAAGRPDARNGSSPTRGAFGAGQTDARAGC